MTCKEFIDLIASVHNKWKDGDSKTRLDNMQVCIIEPNKPYREYDVADAYINLDGRLVIRTFDTVQSRKVA